MKCFTKPYQGFQTVNYPVITFFQRVCSLFETSTDEVMIRCHKKNVCHAKQVMFYHLRVVKRCTYDQVAKLMNKKSHDVIINGFRRFYQDYETDSEFRRKCKLLGIEL